MKFSSQTKIVICKEDPDWASNDQEYKWGPFDGSGSYQATIFKSRDRILSVLLKVPGEDEIKLESVIANPRADSTITVSLLWDVTDGYRMTQNGGNARHVPFPAPPQSPPG